ncbi:MAG TPA: hypothetical protein VGS07_12580 [Thermoanaerobaculia bacterium]|nr:hypothetical protein [Thermoanaerobaculia bacterium]
MSFELAQKVADAILYEGYVLYPYRASSSKNKVRFQWGVVAPRDYSQAGGSESWEMQTECLVEPIDQKLAPRIELKIRCLQLQERLVEEATGPDTFRPVEFLNVGDEMLVAWDEGIEQELELGGIDLRDLARDGASERRIAFDLPGGSEDEELRASESPEAELCGRLVRRRWPISAVVRLSAEKVDDYLRLRVRIENLTPGPEGMEREEALRRSLVSAHTMLAVRDGRFVSLLDPPEAAAQAVAGCVNLHTWPVLAGPEGSGEVVLSSPIILYDHPAIAPESPNDLCDATEIDEILTLRIMTLTDEEKREARGTDPRARRIVDRANSIPDEILERLHGAVRSLRSVDAVESAPVVEDLGPFAPLLSGRLEPAIAGWEEFLNPPGETPPEEATLTIADVLVGKGTRVRLRPSRRADSMDFFLAGRDARVTGIYRDVEDACYVAVSLTDDDPTGDLHEATGRFFYFYPDEIEPLEDRP